LLPSIVRQVLNGAVTIHRDARRDLLDAADFCYVIDRLFGLGVSNTVLNVASGVAQPIELIVERVEARLGVSAERSYVPGRAWQTDPSIDRLLKLVPEFRRDRIGPRYLEHILDSYLCHLVHLREASLPGGAVAAEK
jgi:hypothetical protein